VTGEQARPLSGVIDARYPTTLACSLYPMPIVIARDGDSYSAEVTPPHGRGRHWKSPDAMGIDALIEALLALGCHQTDIGDALYEADPDWESRTVGPSH
jgi:hypothetical protein